MDECSGFRDHIIYNYRKLVEEWCVLLELLGIDGFTTDYNHFTLTRHIEGELWTTSVPNVWIIAEVEAAPTAPPASPTTTVLWGRLKTQ